MPLVLFWSGVSDLDISLNWHEAPGGGTTLRDTNLGVAQALFEP